MTARRPRVAATAALASLVLGACATVPPDAGLAGVETAVSGRLGEGLRWSRGPLDEAALAEAVRARLRGPLTAERAVEIALLGNRDLQAAYEALGIARADLVQAGLIDNPVFGVEIRFNGATEATLNVAQNILSLLTLPARRPIAARALERAQLRLAHKILDVAAEVRVAYYRVVADEQALGVFRQVVTATEAAAELAERQVQAGTLGRRDQAVQQVLYARAVLELGHLEVQRVADREALNRLLGLWGEDTAWTLPERLPDAAGATPNPEGLEALAVERRLDLAAARAHVETATRALELGRSTRLLSVLGLGVEFERDSEGWKQGPTLRLGLPLFDQGQARVAALEAELREREQAWTGLAVTVRSQVREAWARLAAARAAVMHYRDVLLPLGQEIVAENQRLYNGMLIGVYDLLRSKQDQVATAREYVEALRDYWIARSALERVLGGPLPGPRGAGPGLEPTVPIVRSGVAPADPS